MKTMRLQVVFLSGVFLLARICSAGTFTWDGGGADNYWQSATNWVGDAAPDSDGTATLAFVGSTRLATTNDFAADTVFAGINFLNDYSSGKTAAFALSGNRITLGGNITTTVPTVNGTVTDTNALDLVLNGTRTITLNNISNTKYHNLIVSGVISETNGPWGLTKAGGADLTLTGANTYSGKTTLSGGRVYYNSISNVGAAASALGAPTTVENGTIDINARMTYTGGATTSDRVLNFLSGSTFENSGSGTVTLTGGITGAGQTPFIRGNSTFVISGLIATGAGGMTRTDGGTLILTNPTNAFTGALNILDGIISADTFADAGVACPIGAGSTILLGQGNGTTGRLRFTGTNDMSCNRTITVTSRGALQANGGIIENATAGTTLTLSGNVSVNLATNTPSLQLTGVGNGVLSGVINGAMRVTMNGSAVWTLSGANVYTGATTVSSGTLQVNGATAAGSAVSVAAAGTLAGTGTVYGAVSVAAGGKIAPGAGGVGTLTLANAGASALTLNGNTVTCEVSAVAGVCDRLDIAGTLVLNGANTLALGFPAGSAPAGVYTQLTYAAKSGSGTLALDHAYPNATLDVGATAAVLTITGGGSASSLVWVGGSDGNAWNTTSDNWSPVLYGDGGIVLFDDTGSASPAVDITPVAVAPYSVAVNASVNAYTIGGAAITGTCSLTKSGNAALTLTGANTYSGPTAVNAGPLTLSGSLSNSSVTVASGAVFTQGVAGVLSGAGVTVTSSGAVTLQGVSTHTGATTINLGPLVLSGLIDGSSITVAATNASLTQSAGSVIAGASVALTLRGSSTLSGTNTYGGETTVGIAGIPNINVTVNNNRALGSSAGGTTVLGGNGSLLSRLYLNKGVTVSNETLTLNGTAGRAGLNYNQTSGSATWDGNIVAMSAAYITSDQAGGTLVIGSSEDDVVTNSGACSLSIRGGGNIVMNSRVSIGAGNTLLRNDAGTLLLNTASNVWGGTGLAEGTLKLGVADALPATTTLTIGKDGNVNNKATFDLNGFKQQIAGLVESHYLGGGGWQRIFSADPATLIVSNETANTFGAEGGTIIGAVSLVKLGSGTLTLTGTNTTFGSFIVSNGTLWVSAAGTFGVNSTNVVVAGGTLVLSNSSAIADSAALSIANGGGAKVDLAAGVNETVAHLYYGDSQRRSGTYGATGSGADYTSDAHFLGTGKLTVLGGYSGTTIMLR